MILLPDLPFVLTVVTKGWYGEPIAFAAVVPDGQGAMQDYSTARLSDEHVRTAENLTSKEQEAILKLPVVATKAALCEQFWSFWEKWIEHRPFRLQFIYDEVLHPGALPFLQECVRVDETLRRDLDPLKVDVATLLITHGYNPRTSRYVIAKMAGGEVGNLTHLALAIAACYTDLQKIIEGT
ncbi:MAG: hypothetical protein QG621_50 [Patescibacteria group bacterium]|jgi:hypothetical protein|nr:hypothetical protein [Patescibacteria group bacterium]